METWNYGYEGKGFVLSDELIPNTDALARSRTVVMGWDLKSPFNYENTKLDASRELNENQGFMEFGFPDITRKTVPDNLFGGVLDSSPTCVSSSKEFSQEESSSRFSTTAGNSYSRESSFIDLKLGSLADYRDTQTAKSPKEMSSVSSVVSSVPEKRARTTSLTYQNPVCQVHGCNMDLSNSKDYHKRHKVCDIHSKTAKVIVNGIEQRFCQQCSRFHLLAEFDDGKRSCRKRLAGHNERRRKPQLDNQTGRNGKLHLPYHGNRFLGTSLPTRTPFINPDIFADSIMQPVKYENSNWCRRVKLEEEFYNPSPMVPIMDEHFISKSSLPLFGVQKQYPFLHGNGLGTAAGSHFCENSNRYLHSLTDPDSGTGFVLQTVPSDREEITIYDSTSTIQRVSGASDSSSALSLLSSHSMNSSSHSTGIPMGQSLLIQGNHAHYNLDQLSEKPFGANSHSSSTLVSNRFSSSAEFDRFEPIVVSDGSNSVDFDVHTDRIIQGSEFTSAKNPLPHIHNTTIDLLQLSSQLHRVENERNSMQVKQETDLFLLPSLT